MLTAIALFLAAPRVTLRFGATPLPLALSQLTAATGRFLVASSALKNEVLVVRLHDASVEDVLTAIPKCLLAKWSPRSDGVLALVPDSKARESVQTQLAAEEDAKLGRSLQYVIARLAEQPAELDQAHIVANDELARQEEARRKEAELKQDYATMFQASTAAERTPGWRIAARLLLAIGRPALLEMPNDAREVWAESPTAVQRAFPPATMPYLSAYRRELKIAKPTVDVLNLRLAIVRWEEGASFNVKLEGIGPDGKVADSAFIRLNDDSERLKTRRVVDTGKPGDTQFTVGPDAIEAREALTGESKSADHDECVERFRPKSVDPVQFEPTQWHRSADLLAVADATGKNLIATVDDSISARFFSINHHAETVESFMRRSAGDFIEGPAGWLVSRPHVPSYRVPRVDGRYLIRQSVKQGGLPVDDAAAYVAADPDRFPFTNWVGDYLAFLHPSRGPYSLLATTLDEQSLRLWGDLGQSARFGLRQGHTLNLDGLSMAAREQIRRLVYWHSGLDDAGDPTVLMPDGIVGGTVSMTSSETPIFLAWPAGSPEPTHGMPMDPAMFGRGLAKGNRYWELDASVYRRYNRFRLGLSRKLSLHFSLQPGSKAMTIELSEILFDPSKPALDSLPADLQAKVDDARKAALAEPPEKPDAGTASP